VVADGLGAMAAALALARAGIDVQVYEQAQQLTEASADVSLAPNRLRMLKRLGSARGSGEWPHGTAGSAAALRRAVRQAPASSVAG